MSFEQALRDSGEEKNPFNRRNLHQNQVWVGQSSALTGQFVRTSNCTLKANSSKAGDTYRNYGRKKTHCLLLGQSIHGKLYMHIV